MILDGLIKTDYPGSLHEPAATYLFPLNWSTLPLSFGLLMSPWGGHAVFPNIYRDMRHPKKYGTSLKVTFSFTVSDPSSLQRPRRKYFYAKDGLSLASQAKLTRFE